jgi:pilus assembly protein CpaF
VSVEPTPAPPLDAEVLHRRLLDSGAAPASPEERRALLRSVVREAAPLLGSGPLDAALSSLDARVSGLGPLDPLLADADVSEVMVNGDGTVWVERWGRLEPVDTRLDAATTLGIVERIVGPLGLHVDRASPMVDARLPDGSRVNAVVAPLSVDGPCLTIRRFGARQVALDEVCAPGVAELLAWAVRSRLNVVVCGGAGAGKTTLLNALASQIPAHERIVTVEDTAELRLPHPHVVRLEARPGNAEGVGAVTVRDLVRNALRMRPDRIVVGEARGGEALDLLQAMLTGHDGSLATCHANDPPGALRRLETLTLLGDVGLPLGAVREQLAAAVDLVVHIARRPGGGRAVRSVAEVDPRPGPDTLGARLLTVEGRLASLPARPARSVDAPPPDPGWLR